MAQIIRIIYDADTTDLQRTRELFKEIAKESGLTEKQVEEISNEIGKQTGLINRLVAAEKQLVAERNKSMNPAQIQKLNAQIAATRAEVDKLTGRVQQAGLNIQKVFQQVGIAISAAFVISKVKDFLVSAVQMAAVMEQNRIAFTNFTGSAEKANALLTKIEKFAARTPFQFPELVESTKQLLAFGIEQENVMDTLNVLGDIAAGTGSNLKDLAFVYGTIRTQQTAYTQDLNQFASRGIPIYDAIAKRFGIMGEEVKKFAADGKIKFADIEAAFKSMTQPGEKFFNMMENQSKTALGQFSTLMDNIGKRMREIGEVILLVGKPLISFFNNLIGGTEEVTNEFFEQEKELRKTRASLNAYVTSLGSLTQGSEAYKATIDRINQVSPDFFKGLDMQKVSYEEILDRLKEVNSELDINIGLLQRQGVVQEFSDKASEAAENIGKISVRIQELAFGLDGSTKTQFDIAVKRMIEMKVPLEDIIGTIKEWKGNEAASFRVLAQEFEKNTKNLEIYTKAQGDATAALEKYAKEMGIDLEALRKKNKEDADAKTKIDAHAKAVDDLAKALKKLREEAELAAVGGANTEAGIAILRARAIAELEAAKGFTQLTEDEQGALRLAINQEWDDKLIALRKKTAEDSAKITADLNKEIEAFRKEAFDKEVADSKRLSDIKILQAKKDFADGLIDEIEMQDRILSAEAEFLAARFGIERQFAMDTLATEEELAEKRIAIHENAEKRKTEVTKDGVKERTKEIEDETEKMKEAFELLISQLLELFDSINALQAARADQRLSDIEAARQEELAAVGDNEAAKAEIEKKFDAISERVQREENLRKQRAAVSQALIDGALAEVKILSQFGLPLALPFMALAAVLTGIQVAAIKAQKFAKGTLAVKGSGSETSDSVPAMLSINEAVTPAREAREYGPTLRAIHSRMIPPQMLNAFVTGRLRLPMGETRDGFSDSRIVDRLTLQNRNSKSLLTEMRRQNLILKNIAKSKSYFGKSSFTR